MCSNWRRWWMGSFINAQCIWRWWLKWAIQMKLKGRIRSEDGVVMGHSCFQTTRYTWRCINWCENCSTYAGWFSGFGIVCRGGFHSSWCARNNFTYKKVMNQYKKRPYSCNKRLELRDRSFDQVPSLNSSLGLIRFSAFNAPIRWFSGQTLWNFVFPSIISQSSNAQDRRKSLYFNLVVATTNYLLCQSNYKITWLHTKEFDEREVRSVDRPTLETTPVTEIIVRHVNVTFFFYRDFIHEVKE